VLSLAPPVWKVVSVKTCGGETRMISIILAFPSGEFPPGDFYTINEVTTSLISTVDRIVSLLFQQCSRKGAGDMDECELFILSHPNSAKHAADSVIRRLSVLSGCSAWKCHACRPRVLRMNAVCVYIMRVAAGRTHSFCRRFVRQAAEQPIRQLQPDGPLRAQLVQGRFNLLLRRDSQL
jgi:hypothetical protein